jgi:hypothetical protein
MEKVMTRISLIALSILALATAGCAEKSEVAAKDDKPVYTIPVPLA